MAPPRRPSPIRPPKGGLGITARGPQKLQAALKPPRQAMYPPPMIGWPGTEDEWAIFWAHSKLGLVQHRDWDYQTPESGGRHFGGLVLDFYEYDVGIGINVQGIYWHYNRGTQVLMRDKDQAWQVAHYGLQLIFIDEDDALANPVYMLKEARLGNDHSRAALR